MSTHLFEHRIPPPRSRTAWLASFAVHASTLLILGYVSWTTLGSGPKRGPTADTSVVLGLSDGTGAGEEANSGETAPPLLETPAAETEPGDGLSATATMSPLPTAAASTEPLTPAPQLPLLALGGTTPTRATPTNSNGAGAGSGTSPNLNAQLRQLQDRATVTVFGAVGEGSRFVYLFDRSTSMDGAPLLAAKEQLIASLDALKPVHQFQVVFFNHGVQIWDMTGGQRRIPYATDSNKRLAADFVESISASGGTERWRPLNAALAMTPDVIFFLTDADDGMGDRDITDIVQRAERQGTKINCIEYGIGPSKQHTNFLWEIASRTRANYVYVDTTELFKK